MSVNRLDGRGGLIVRGDKYLEIPKGGVATRPEADTGARAGMIRFNTDTSIYEGYNGTSWVPLVSGAWSVVQGSTDEYAAASGEQILVNTFADGLTIVLSATAFEGDSVRIADAGYASNAGKEIVVKDTTGSVIYTIVNSFAEITFVKGTIGASSVSTWNKVDLETFITDGVTKAEVEGGQVTISGGDLEVTTGVIRTPKITVSTAPVAGTDGTNKTYVDAADTVLQTSVNAVNTRVNTTNNRVSAIEADLLDTTGGSGINITTGTTKTISVDVQTNSGLSTTGGLHIDIAGTQVFPGVTPGINDQLLMDISGTLNRVTKSQLLAGLLSSPRVIVGTGTLTDNAATGVVNSGVGTALDVGGVDGAPPAAGDGAEYLIADAAVNNTITGSARDYSAGDSVVWFSSAWNFVGGAGLVPTGVESFRAHDVTSIPGRQGHVQAAAGDYTASQIESVAYGTIPAGSVQSAINDLEDDKADIAEINNFSQPNSFADTVDIIGLLTFDDAKSTGTSTFNIVDASTLNVSSTSTLSDTITDNISINGNINNTVNGVTVTPAGVNLTETSSSNVPTINIVNNNGINYPRKADISIENANPAIKLDNTQSSTNYISVEAIVDAGSNLETFNLLSRVRATPGTGADELLLLVNSNRTELYSQLWSTSGSALNPGISFKTVNTNTELSQTGLYATERVTSIDSNQLGISIDGVSKVVIRDDAIAPSVKFEGQSAIVIPSGLIKDRPIGEHGAMRFNIEVNQFEGFDGVEWGPLGSQVGAVTVDWYKRDADVTVIPNAGYMVDTSNAPVIVTLPPGRLNNFVWITDYKGTSSANPITIKSTGNNAEPIMGVNESLEISSANASVQLTYIDNVIGWKITSGLGEFAGSDAVYWNDPINSDFTAEPFLSYMVDTTISTVTVTLPAVATPSEFFDSYVRVADWAGTAPVNNIIIDTNGSPFNGVSNVSHIIRTANAAITFTYIDAAQGWKITSGSGTGGSNGIDNWEFINAVTTPAIHVSPGNAYAFDTTSASVTASLPAAPNQFDIIHFLDHKGTCSINPINITRNGKLINGETEDLVIDLDRAMVQLTYMGNADSEGWVVTNGVGEGGGGGAARDNWEIVRNDFTAMVGGDYQCDTSDTTGGPIIITLPSGASANDNIKIADYTGNCFNNNITITSTDPIMGLPDELILDFNNVTIELTYLDDASQENIGWKITNGIGEGGSGGSGMSQEWQTITDDTAAEVGGAYLVNTNIQKITVTLPVDPDTDDSLWIADYLGTASQNNIIITSPDLIMGSTDNLEIDLDNASVQLTYINSSIGWKIVDGIGEGGVAEGSDPIEELLLLNSGQTSVRLTSVDAIVSAFFVDGIRLMPTYDYVVVSAAEITLLRTFPQDSVLLAVQNDADGAGSVWNFVTIEENIVLGANQTKVTFNKIQTRSSFSVYVNGIRLTEGTEYAKDSAQLDTITLLVTFPSGSAMTAVQNEPNDGTDVSEGLVVATGSTQPRALNDRFADTVNVKDFGAVGDGRLPNGSLNPNPTDDTAAIQAALSYACLNGRSKVVADSKSAFHTTSTIYIPTIYRSPGIGQFETATVIDFQGAEFIGEGINESTQFSCFESGYFDVDGNIQSVIGTGNNFYLTTGTQLMNASLTGYYRGLNLKGWVYGCAVKNIFCVDVAQAVQAHWCFYTHFEQIINRGAYLVGVPRFKFEDEANIQPIKGCITGHCDIGFEFSGRVEALRLVDCGIEGFITYGVVTKGQFNIKFESCYFESNEAGCIAYSGDSLINHVTFDNCWGFGADLQMLGDFANNVNVRIEPNNVLGSGARWFDSLPNYTLSDFNFPNRAEVVGVSIPTYDAPDAVNIKESITVRDDNFGFDKIVGRVKQTSQFHEQKVNGKFSDGFSITTREGVGYQQVIEPEISNRRVVTLYTEIDWSETQNIYVALRIAHNVDVWTYYGNIYGENIVVNFTSGTGVIDPITVQQDVNGKVVIKTPSLPVSPGGTVSITSGEIRLT